MSHAAGSLKPTKFFFNSFVIVVDGRENASSLFFSLPPLFFGADSSSIGASLGAGRELLISSTPSAIENGKRYSSSCSNSQSATRNSLSPMEERFAFSFSNEGRLFSPFGPIPPSSVPSHTLLPPPIIASSPRHHPQPTGEETKRKELFLSLRFVQNQPWCSTKRSLRSPLPPWPPSPRSHEVARSPPPPPCPSRPYRKAKSTTPRTSRR